MTLTVIHLNVKRELVLYPPLQGILHMNTKTTETFGTPRPGFSSADELTACTVELLVDFISSAARLSSFTSGSFLE